MHSSLFLLTSHRKGVPGLFKLVLGSKEADNTPKEPIIVHPPTSEGVTAANSEDKNIHWVLVNNEFYEVFSSGQRLDAHTLPTGVNGGPCNLHVLELKDSIHLCSNLSLLAETCTPFLTHHRQCCYIPRPTNYTTSS